MGTLISKQERVLRNTKLADVMSNELLEQWDKKEAEEFLYDLEFRAEYVRQILIRDIRHVRAVNSNVNHAKDFRSFVCRRDEST